jgi:hypothetical protein
LFVFILIAHRRREVLHFNITEHPTAEWISQQILEAFADRDVAKYLIRDRDGVYGGAVGARLAALNIRQVLTAPANPMAECLRRKAHWHNSTGMFESRHHI